MNLNNRCGSCKDFEEEDPQGFGHCKAFGGYPYKGNHEPCFEKKAEATQ
ncbi:hypothetical protein M0R72_19640 [Candidatus Pacearchaeota archaeon]|jgi:hypothetical protein|nr:hypothetical protein [Candidatus Pacearchaeota archaeon]